MSFALMMHKITIFWEKVRRDSRQVAYDRISLQVRREAYWFAGFQDKVDPQALLETLGEELRCSDGFSMSQLRDKSIERTRKIKEDKCKLTVKPPPST